jgi:tRNA-dihydrouridine synthase B
MLALLNDSFNIGSLKLPNRLIQGPLAGFSCAPFREQYYSFSPPAYCVSEMISAYDVLHKHKATSRYLYRSPKEKTLCYQLSGTDPQIIAKAAGHLEAMGADLIDLNCGCPKTKIRKKGAGSALLERPERLGEIVSTVRKAIYLPLTVKVRIQGNENDIALAKAIEEAGADALVVHGRRWTDDYDTPCNLEQIKQIKLAVNIPVIANGDITDKASLAHAVTTSNCDAYMISRAGSGNPWLYQQLLAGWINLEHGTRINCFINHLQSLARLENDYQAVLQSKALVRYYFRHLLTAEQLQHFYLLDNLSAIETYIKSSILPI